MDFNDVMEKIDAAWTELEGKLHETFSEKNESVFPLDHDREPSPKPLISMAYCVGSFSIRGEYPKVDRRQLAGSDRFIHLNNPSFTVHLGDAFPEGWQELRLLLDDVGKLAGLASGTNPFCCHTNWVGFVPSPSSGKRSISYGQTLAKATRWYGEHNVRDRVAELWDGREDAFASAFYAYQAEAAAYRQPDTETAAETPSYLDEAKPEYLH